MTYGLAQRNRRHVMGFTPDDVFTPRWRVVASLIVAKGVDGRLQHCYGGDVLDGLSPEQAAHFCRLGMVQKIDADEPAAIA